MVVEAEKYVDVLPDLEWTFLWERAMCIEADSGIGLRRIVSTSEVKGNWSYFKDMFGLL
jgi:hypothetical protein